MIINSTLSTPEIIHISVHFATAAMWCWTLILLYYHRKEIKWWIVLLIYIAGTVCVANLIWQATVSDLHLQSLPSWAIYNGVMAYLLSYVIHNKSIRRYKIIRYIDSKEAKKEDFTDE